MPTSNNPDLVGFLDRMQEEGELRRDETPLKDADLNLRFLRGDQWPASPTGSPFRPSGAGYRFTLNLLNQIVKRKVALITDSRPQMEVIPYTRKRQGVADVVKYTMMGLWDEQNFDQSAARELVRAATIGSTMAVPIWDETANYGRGDIRVLMYDPRQVVIDPSVTRSIDLQRHGEFMQVFELRPIAELRERYQDAAEHVQGDSRWSTYQEKGTQGQHRPFQSIASAIQRPWKRDQQRLVESATPRALLRHTWFKDWQRDDRGQPVWSKPRIVRYVADADRQVLRDEPMQYWHRQLPGHLYDWDIELEHPHGMSEVGGLRRLQYTLNRIVGQIMDNVILTNRVRTIADSDAVDAKTWQLISANPNGVFIRKRQGRTFNYELPVNALPPFLLPLIEVLVRGFDLQSGLTEVTRGATRSNTSGVAIEGLQMAAQSIVRLEARAFENWLERIFQQVVALIFQYFPTERTFSYHGPGPGMVSYTFERYKLLDPSGNGDVPTRPDEEWRDFRFRILPGSSLAMSRVQRGIMAANLYQLGLIPGIDVLRASEWPSPEETLKQAREEAATGVGPVGGARRLQKAPGTTRRDQAIV